MIKRESLFEHGDTTRSERSLHTPGSFAKQNLLYVQEVGRLESLKPHRCIRENVDSFLFMVVLEGKGSLDIEGKHYDMNKGSCALVNCREHYEHISDEADAWKLAWVHFNGNAAKAYYELFLKGNCGENVFQTEDIALWNLLIGELLEYQKDKSQQAELRCGEGLLHLLNQIIENTAETRILDCLEDKEAVRGIREFLNEQYADAEVKHKAAAEFGLEYDMLSRKFETYFGISIEEYISNRRLNAAKELLRFSIKPVEEVAVESGIGDVQLMQQMFRDSEEMTAEEYRAKWAAWIR